MDPYDGQSRFCNGRAARAAEGRNHYATARMTATDRTISEVTRRAIADRTVGHFDWAGRFSETDFLSRLYDLSLLPSYDHRSKTAAGDIATHRERFCDWNDDWIFYDDRFALLRCPDAEFLRFLAETVHPVVRPWPEQTDWIVVMYNEQLRVDGWQLVPSGEISGRPVFRPERLDQVPEVFEEPTGWDRVDREVKEILTRLRQARAEEQFQGVGHLCRELLISLARAVYDPARHPPLDEKSPSPNDAKRMLESYLAVELSGSGNSDARKHARAAFDLANSVQHDRVATFRDAALCAEAALSVVRIVGIVSGRRDYTSLEV